MNTKNLVLIALLMAVGTALYAITPGIIQGMKPDFILTMMILCILLFPTLKEALLISLTAGVLSGLFSTFPAGFLPNVIDKLVTGLICLLIVSFARHLVKSLAATTVIVGVGTLLSGTIFLSIVFFIFDMTIGSSFLTMFLIAVLPAIGFNVAGILIIHPIIKKLLARSSYQTAMSN